ncbi:DUF6682 family protein [Variovorax sp. PAMC26660]|uniref:phage adaptor protein n=1 Tax=Variovorax sp. PAMC26660 TaxID=2762322 RepID=UPI00164D749A|nr:DUF6682 family protein [Variovorax sp. PAMC26660]QNK66085.1 hypothetical protein H7F35_23175 [Variovorax sp. PAMC26660]
MLAKQILRKARFLLSDPDAVRWSDPDLLGWLNSAQLQIVAVRPDAKATKVDHPLALGVEQVIPANGTKLLDVIRNTSGRAVTLISRDQLSSYDPDWYTSAPSATTKHYTFDESDPKSFEVFPPAAAGAKVRLLYAAIPTDCADVDSAIDLDAIYEGPLIDFVCYRAWAQDSDNPGDAGNAANAISTFMQALTGKTQSDQATRPARK